MKVLSIDPGGTTGYTIAEYADGILNIRPQQEKMTPRRFMEFLQLHESSTDHVLCEDFEFRKGARAGLDLTPAHLIGVVMAIVPEDKLRLQRAAYGKSRYKEDSQIKTLKLWIPGKPHAMDSLRHFLQWFNFGPGYRYERPTVMQLDPLRPT